jgi:hypothetical protein
MVIDELDQIDQSRQVVSVNLELTGCALLTITV